MPSANDGVYWDHYYPHLAGGTPHYAGQGQDRRRMMIAKKLTEIAMNRFEWTGFPEEVQLDNTRWLEKCLFETALAVFYYDDEWSRHFVMRAAPAGVWNMIGNPTKYLAYGNQYYNKWLEADDCVPIWANYLRFPDFEVVSIYSEILSEIDQTIQVNAKNARRTKIIRVSEKSRLSFDNIQRQIDAGETFIKVLPELPSLTDAMEAIDLGIDPSSLIDDQVSVIRATNLKARQEAAAQIADQFGFDVEVNYVTDLAAAPLEDGVQPPVDAGQLSATNPRQKALGN
jgi:hypothetical protein